MGGAQARGVGRGNVGNVNGNGSGNCSDNGNCNGNGNDNGNGHDKEGGVRSDSKGVNAPDFFLEGGGYKIGFDWALGIRGAMNIILWPIARVDPKPKRQVVGSMHIAMSLIWRS